ncbi:MAG: hypothetical protein ACLQVI_00620 [Polyangiaceae bacterium]
MSIERTITEQFPDGSTITRPAIRWTNPTADTQRVTVQVSPPVMGVGPLGGACIVTPAKVREYLWQPGESLDVPAIFAAAIHRVACPGSQRCKMGFCSDPQGHAGSYLLGGGAPQLRREGQAYELRGDAPEVGAPPPRPLVPAQLADPLAVGAADASSELMRRARARAAARAGAQ